MTMIDRTDQYQARGVVGSGDAVIETTEGIEIKRGVGDLFIPADELLKVEKIGAEMAAESEATLAEGRLECQQCGEWFFKRAKSGGKPHKYCGEPCRRAADAERKANALNAPERADDEKHSGMSDATVGELVAIGLARGMKIGESRALATAAKPEPADAFDWGADDSVVVPEQQAVAVYWNVRGELVIRQERTWDQDEDTFVVIARWNVDAFIDKLTDICGIPSVGK